MQKLYIYLEELSNPVNMHSALKFVNLAPLNFSMNAGEINKTSKFLSLVLRHKPETIGLTLDENGWALTGELLLKMAAAGYPVSMQQLEEIVAWNDKKRFAFNANLTAIRASQGHSLSVDLSLEPSVPPLYLYHGTAEKFINAIKQTGLQKMARQYVHLSTDKVTAEKVGARKGKVVVLTILAQEMYKDGYGFFISANRVWLCDAVPVQYIQF